MSLRCVVYSESAGAAVVAVSEFVLLWRSVCSNVLASSNMRFMWVEELILGMLDVDCSGVTLSGPFCACVCVYVCVIDVGRGADPGYA